MSASGVRGGAAEAPPTVVAQTAVDILDLPPELSPFRRALHRFLSHRPALIGLTVILILALMGLLADYVTPFEPTRVHVHKVLHSPDTVNWLGTDQVGRDVLSRIAFGARVSMSVGLVAVSIYLVIAFAFGATAGLLGGRVDNLIMRFTDVVMTFPSFILILVIAGILGPNIFNVMVIIGIFGWPGLARLIRGQILVLRELDYVVASRALGASHWHIMFRHLLPNIIGPVSVAITLGVAGAILAEAGLSFLGLGVSEPTASWGSMISQARGIAYLADMPWMWIAPGAAISITVLSINFIGDGLRDAFDVRGGRVGG
ncbi:MAG: ABC transporter permease [Actinobacteria bacterium]|nr:ABC transporter permease [Actinomycetota bacterium]